MSHIQRSSEIMIIGCGASGLLCALELKAAGMDVDVIGRGTPATAMSGGCISSMGDPSSLTRLGLDVPLEMPRDTAMSFTKFVSEAGLDYVRTSGPLIDAHGMWHDADLCQGWTLSSADLENAASVELLFPDHVADLLPLHLPDHLRKNTLMTTVERSSFDDTDRLLTQMAGSSADLVVIPPSFGLTSFASSMRQLERESGKNVRETYAALGLPGRRLAEALRSVAARTGVRLHDMEVTGFEVSEGKVCTGMVRSGLRPISWQVEQVVHCGGGLVGGGLDVSGTDAKDQMSVFDMASLGNGKGAMNILMQGLAVDPRLHLFSHNERLDNALAAGSVLPGLNLPSGAGLGPALITAHLAAQEVLHGR